MKDGRGGRAGAALALGAACLLAYAAAVWISWPRALPRLLYDGYTPPPPYHWVKPPLPLLVQNTPPQPGDGTVSLTRSGSAPASVVTGDDQAAVVFPPGAIEPRAGASAVEVRITPLDPGRLAPPPRGLRFDGNAYRIDAEYLPDRSPAVLRAPASVVLRYPGEATTLLHLEGSRWQEVQTTRVPAGFQVFASTRQLGVYVAAGPPESGGHLTLWLYRAVTVLLWAAAVLLAVLLVADYVRGGRRRRA